MKIATHNKKYKSDELTSRVRTAKYLKRVAKKIGEKYTNIYDNDLVYEANENTLISLLPSKVQDHIEEDICNDYAGIVKIMEENKLSEEEMQKDKYLMSAREEMN